MVDVQMYPVDSTNLLDVGYDAETLALFVRFTNGRTYRYDRVPEQVYLDLLAMDRGEHYSVGEYFDKAVKRGGYKYEEV